MLIWRKPNGKTHAVNDSFVSLCGHAVSVDRTDEGDEEDVTCLNCASVLNDAYEREIDARRAAEQRAEEDRFAEERRRTWVAQQAELNRQKGQDKWLVAAAVAAVGGFLLYQGGAFDHDPPPSRQFVDVPSGGGDLDCADFSTHAEAQRYYNGQVGDPDGLDRDGDGIACETLP